MVKKNHTKTKPKKTKAKLNQAEAEAERLRNILRKHGINADEADDK